MKDYIVFFTKGFDKHSIERQKHVFENAHVSCIDSSPDYNRLIEESKIAKSHNFDNFYIFWERTDVPSMNREMVAEFKHLFHETGAIPYKYNKLIEGDTSAVAPNAGSQTVNQQQAAQKSTTATQAVGNQAAGTQNTPNNVDDTAPIDNIWLNKETDTIEVGTPPQDMVTRGSAVNLSASVKNERSIYASDHTATVFIWPFNLFMCESYAQTAWFTFANAVKSDNVSRLPKGTTTANSYASKKGNWQRIIYIPNSIQELSQSVARGDTMYHFTKESLQNQPWHGTKIGNTFNKLIITQVLNVGGAKEEFGNLNQTDILAACKRAGATNASIRNIHIYYTPEFEPFMKWCPIDRKTCLSSVNFPKASINKGQMDRLASMKNFIYKNKNDANWLKALNRIYIGDVDSEDGYRATEALNKLIQKQGMYEVFWRYWNYYLTQDDVYGRPDGRKTPSAKDSLENVLDKVTNPRNGDLDQFKKLAGMLTNDDRSKLERDKQNIKNAWDDVKSVYDTAKAIVSNVKGSVEAKKANQAANQAANDQSEETAIVTDGEDTTSQQNQSVNNVNDNNNQDNQNNSQANSQDNSQNESPEEQKNLSDLSDEVLDRLICQLSPEWAETNYNGISWVGHHFYSHEVFAQWDQVGGTDNGVPIPGGFTAARAQIVNSVLNSILSAPAVEGEAADGQNPDTTNVPSNVNTQNNQVDKSDESKNDDKNDDSKDSENNDKLNPGEADEIKNSTVSGEKGQK